MKRLIATVLIMVMMIPMVGCVSKKVSSDSELPETEKTPTKLVELDKYYDMTIDGTKSIEVKYQYQVSEVQIYEFDIEDQETIDKMMTAVFDIGLKKYPENTIVDFNIAEIIVKQDGKSYYIHMGYASDNSGKKYLCDAQPLREIIAEYIMDNLVE